MKDLTYLQRFKVPHPSHLAYKIPALKGPGPLRIIVSTGDGWDHVSVSLRHRVPSYEEMVMVADLFFEDWEVAVQYRVAKRDHINIHSYVLHWWRPLEATLPLPPPELV